MKITYSISDNVTPEEYYDLQKSLDLGWENHRTVKRNAIALQQSHFIATARYNNILIGIIRIITDGAYMIHIADMCIRKQYQQKGIGRKLLELAKEYAKHIKVGSGKTYGEFTLFANGGSLKFFEKNDFMLCPHGMILVDDDIRRKLELESQVEWYKIHNIKKAH